MNLIEQKEALRIMEKYNAMSRRVIKENLCRLKIKDKIKTNDIIIDLGIEKSKAYSWFNPSSNNIPTLIDIFRLVTMYGIDIYDVIDETVNRHYENKKYPVEMENN